jgi:hypothetical protein
LFRQLERFTSAKSEIVFHGRPARKVGLGLVTTASMDRALKIARIANIGLCLLGTLLFAGLLAYLHLAPKDFERRSQGIILAQVQKHMKEKLTPTANEGLERLAGIASQRIAERIKDLQAEIDAGVPKFVAAVIAAMCRVECKDRAALEARIIECYNQQLGRLKTGLQRLRATVEEQYRVRLEALRKDVGIFFASNLIALSVALVLAIVRGPAARHLLPFTVLLAVATALTSWWYVAEQDWVTTIIYSQYFGWSYLGFLAVVFVFLVDIALNRAHVTTEVSNGIGSLFGIPLSLIPC